MDLVQRVRCAYPRLTESHRKAADYILADLEGCAFLSLNELSGRIGVSEATLIRFAQALDFSGYKEFREHLADHIRKIIYTRRPTGGRLPCEETGLDEVKRADLEFIARTMDRINPTRFRELVQRLLEAERIFCLGWRISSFLAEFLAFQLRRIDFPAYALVRERRTLLEQAAELRPGDFVIAFDQLLYSTEVFEAVNHLGRKKPEVGLATVTSDPLARIVQYSDLNFFIDLSGQRDFSLISLTGPMCFINALIEELIAARPDQARAALDRYQREVLSKQNHALAWRPGAPPEE